MNDPKYLDQQYFIKTKIQKQKWGKTQYLRMAIILLLEEMQWTRMIHVMQCTLILTGKGWKGIIYERYDYFVFLFYWVATKTLKALHNCAPFRFKYFKKTFECIPSSIMIIITVSMSSHACNIIYPFFLYLFKVPSGLFLIYYPSIRTLIDNEIIFLPLICFW